MLPERFKIFLVNAEHRTLRVVVFGVLGVLVGSIAASFVLSRAASDAPAPEPIHATYVMAASEPARLRIPSVGIEAPFESPLGVEENGEIEVPEGFDTVGWYKYGPTPGELGPAVVLGHVDSYEGPEIFYDLRDVEVGDRVEIEREDGTVAIFEVTELQKVSQDEFPTARVYGDLDHAGLRLITCSGRYDRGTRRYSHNLIVYARLVSEDPAAE